MTHFDIPDDALDWMRISTKRSSKAEVIRDALAVYQVLVLHSLKDHRIFVGRDRDNSAELIVTALTGK